MAEAFRDDEFPRLLSLGRIGLGHIRPSDAFHLKNGMFFLRTYRTVVGVFVDGACRGNGTAWAKGGYGVYFGPDSLLNVSKPLKENSHQTSQRAELMAALVALNQIERFVNMNRNNDIRLDLFVILSDSAYLINSLTSYINKWRENDYTAASGREVANRDLFERLDYKLDAMANGRQGIDVLFCKVDRSENEEADELARDGADI